MKRWKKALCCVLALVMVMCLLPTVALAEGDGDGAPVVEKPTVEDQFDGATWIYVSNEGTGSGESEDDPTNLPTAFGKINRDGAYRKFVISLVEDVQNGSTPLYLSPSHSTVSIIGNGHIITSSRPIQVTNNTALHFGKADGSDNLLLQVRLYSGSDNTTPGVVYLYDGVRMTSDDPAKQVALDVYNGSTAYMYGGEIYNTNNNCVQVHGGTFYMYGGKLHDSTQRCVFVERSNSKFYLYNGEIYNAAACGVDVLEGEFYMYGGKISNCIARRSNSYGGGALCVDSSSSAAHIYGGEFNDNTAAWCGGAILVLRGATLEINGDVRFTDNAAEWPGDDIYVSRGNLTLNTGNIQWFYDGAGDPEGNHRYNETLENGENYVKEFTETECTDPIALKAAVPEEPEQPANPVLPLVPPILGGLPSTIQTHFVEVRPMDYYFDAVNWAYEYGITGGTGKLTFSPDAPCTRAQAVTFLWRAMGSPAAMGSNPFTDVDRNAYYYDAVLWAVENGITNGTGATTFSPDAPCTRAQIVTLLYRAVGAKSTAEAGFTDVPASAYYAGAVNWATEQKITDGTGANRFSPDAACTRAQIVTFLYRAN